MQCTMKVVGTMGAQVLPVPAIGQKWRSSCLPAAAMFTIVPMRTLNTVSKSRTHFMHCQHVVQLPRGRCIPFAVETEATGESESEAENVESEEKRMEDALPAGDLIYSEPEQFAKLCTSFKLIFALPWKRFKKGSVLTMELEGDIQEVLPGMFSRATSLPAICECLIKGAYDPRVAGLFIKVGPLSCGWAKVEEIRRHIDFFRQSGKHTIGYMERGNEKEYFLMSACKEVYLPPSGTLGLRGLSVSATFLRGTLNKVGIEPQVRRIGKYKSAGDQLLREDMSEPQREQLTALLEDLYGGFVAGVAKSRGKAENEVIDMLEEGFVDTESFREGGWVTDLKYMDELIDMLKERQKVDKKKKLKRVTLRRYASVSPSAFGLGGRQVIAIIRASGTITGAKMAQAGSITTKQVIREIQQARDNKSIKAIVLRVDSPGGDALASDLMWRELRVAAAKKPVIASMSDVAASGGYYLSMAASKIVAEGLTITGSIGVILGKFSLQELYKKIGVGKEMLSKGRYAEIFADSRSFSQEEEDYFTRLAEHSYEEFRNKAADCRGMAPEDMQELAQGRVWSGQRAVDVGLIDAVGGVSRAVALAKQAAGISPEKPVRLMELSRQKGSPLEALQGAGALTNTLTWGLFLLLGFGSLLNNHGREGKAEFAIDMALGMLGLAGPVLQARQSDVEYLMEDVTLDDGAPKDFAPQAILHQSLTEGSRTVPPLLRDLISKLL